ncbi:hypothetical protein Tco_0469640 [Tanacetum coccineum]
MSTPTFAATQNLVAFLEKPAESNGFEQIIDFLNAKSIKYALTESIRSDIHFDDAEGTVYLPNDVIFEELAKIGAKTTAWNKFSSTMASAIICLANNQKFNFSKQVEGMSKHKETFVISSHTKKVFANIRRQSDGFSGVVTPLFDNMLVQDFEDIGEDSDHPTDSTQIPIDDQPSTSFAPKKKQKSRRRQRMEAEVPQDEPAHEESVPTTSNDPQPSAKTAQAKKIATLKKRVKKLERKRRSIPTGLRRLRKVGATSKIESSKKKDSLGDQEDPSKHERNIEEIDQDENITLLDETQRQLNDEEMFRVNDLHGEEVTVEDTIAKEIVKDTVAPTIPVTTVEVVTTVSAPKIITSTEELTLAQTLIEIKAAKPKTIKTVTTAATAITTVATIVFITIVTRLNKGKGIMIEPERLLKRKYQIADDEELARQLETEIQAEIEEEERIRRKKEEEANLALIELWENK